MRLVIATTNPGKRAELLRGLGTIPGVVPWVGAPGQRLPAVDEDGASYEENASKKARATAVALGVAALADDSGLEVDALDGGPGLHTARFAGPGAQGTNIPRLLSALAGVPATKRGARLRAVLALADPTGPLGAEIVVRTGLLTGTITEAPRGDRGFGYASVFVPTGQVLTLAELPGDVTDRLGHRTSAARAMATFLAAYAASRGEPAKD